MNRSIYYNRIVSWLAILAIRMKAKNNILDYNIHSENFYADLLNLMYGWELKNANQLSQNIGAIDLIDEKNKLIVQVTSQTTKAKIDTTLANDKLKDFPKYNLKFILITENTNTLKKQQYQNPHGVIFHHSDDICSNHELLNCILAMPPNKQKKIDAFLTEELRPEFANNLESDIVKMIEALASEELANVEEIALNEYKINEKIQFNELQTCADEISRQSIYYGIVEKIFSEYDKSAKNKSLAIKNFFNKKYIKFAKIETDKEAIFWTIIEEVKEHAKEFEMAISLEELDLYASILTVHAFVWCHIFENPKGYNHAIA